MNAQKKVIHALSPVGVKDGLKDVKHWASIDYKYVTYKYQNI